MHRKSISSVKSLATISNVLLSASIVSSLYFGRKLLIPLALSALLMFMLAPFVTRLQRWFGRIGAILLVVGMMFAAVRGRGVGADPAGSRSGKQTPKL
jgi:predicted PurR-regulated permease PerM